MKAIKLATACNAAGVTECRPQGIRATSDNKLYFADSAGLCVYDIATGLYYLHFFFLCTYLVHSVHAQVFICKNK